MANLRTANRQLFSRPADETFGGWHSVLDHLRERDRRTAERPHTSLTASNDDENVYLTGTAGSNGTGAMDRPARMTNWSFLQLCRKAAGSADTINRLSPATAATALNELLSGTDTSGVANVLQTHAGEDEIRALYSAKYERVSDHDVFKFFHAQAEQYGYEPAGTFAGKRGGLPPVRPEASGLYAGDSDSFGIIANEAGKIEIDNSTLYHAVMFSNSEVGKRTLEVTDCLYNFICGNHQLWGATRVRTIRHRHVRSVRDVLDRAKCEIFEMADAERQEHREAIAQTYQTAIRRQFATTTERAKDRLKAYMKKKDAVGALGFLSHEAAYPRNPLSAWGVGQAITLDSQTLPNQDLRLKLDAAAGKIIQEA